VASIQGKFAACAANVLIYFNGGAGLILTGIFFEESGSGTLNLLQPLLFNVVGTPAHFSFAAYQQRRSQDERVGTNKGKEEYDYTFYYTPPKKNDSTMKKLLIICIVLNFSTSSLYSQNKTIKGRVIDNHFLKTLPYVTIMINDTVKVGRTDLKGFFQINVPVSVRKILFGDADLEPTTIELSDTCNDVEVVMMLIGTYDFRTLKQAEKLRMKEFKKLPAIYKEAFAKGIFKTDKACYTQEFMPFYMKKKK
jgi:hypothetical protein